MQMINEKEKSEEIQNVHETNIFISPYNAGLESDELQSHCHCPTGPTGSTGPIATALPAFAKVDIETIDVNEVDPVLMRFPNQQIIPLEILINADNAEFTVTQGGLYMIWVSASVVSGSSLKPARLNFQLNGVTIETKSSSIAYQDVLELTNGDVLSLMIEALYTGELRIAGGQMIIMRLS